MKGTQYLNDDYVRACSGMGWEREMKVGTCGRDDTTKLNV